MATVVDFCCKGPGLLSAVPEKHNRIAVIDDNDLRTKIIISKKLPDVKIIERKDAVNILKNMKDLNIIMNPPYDGSLYLKILDSVIKTFPEAKIVNLSPNFYENYKHTANIPVASNIEVIEKNIASQMFGGIQLSYNLAIQLYGKTKDYSLLTKFTPKAWTILSKKKYKSSFKDVFIEDYDCVGVFVPLKLMTASWDKNKNDIVDKLGILVDGHTENGSYYKDERKKNKNRPCGGIKFSDKIQAQNFVKFF